MPKTTRDNIKRKLAQAYINLNYVGMYLTELETIFRAQHPDLADILDAILPGIITIQEVLKTFAYKSWNDDNPNWQAWAATGRPTHNPPNGSPIAENNNTTEKQVEDIREDYDPTPI